jgi:hypothetical protein
MNLARKWCPFRMYIAGWVLMYNYRYIKSVRSLKREWSFRRF